MRESDAPPPGDPESRRSRLWAVLIMLAIVAFLAWLVLENRDIRRPGRQSTSLPPAPAAPG